MGQYPSVSFSLLSYRFVRSCKLGTLYSIRSILPIRLTCPEDGGITFLRNAPTYLYLLNQARENSSVCFGRI
jgi:hypothetical protein